MNHLGIVTDNNLKIYWRLVIDLNTKLLKEPYLKGTFLTEMRFSKQLIELTNLIRQTVL